MKEYLQGIHLLAGRVVVVVVRMEDDEDEHDVVVGSRSCEYQQSEQKYLQMREGLICSYRLGLCVCMYDVDMVELFYYKHIYIYI